MLATAAALGIHHTWWRGVGAFDWSLGYQKALDAQKLKTEPLAKLLAKYNFKACYHPGGGFTEILDLCRAFDPKHISIDYDTGNFGQFNQGTLANQIRIAGPYVGSFVFKDFYIEHTPPQQQAGAATAAAAASAGRGAATAGRGATPAATAPADAAGGAGGRGGRGAAGRGAPAAGAAEAADGGPAVAAAGGRGGGRGGGGGSPNGWSSRQVPVGSGVLNLAVICQALKDINFQGPIECQPEWPELGGPNSGAERLSIPRAEVIRMLKRDFDTVMTPLNTAGVV
jgi:sugar phosphate isomerase/epimerase